MTVEELDALMDVVATGIKDYTAPMQARLAALEAEAAKVAPLQAMIAMLEAKASVPGPAGVPGRDGRDGKDGADGKAGADGLHGKDGSHGLNGKDGADGLGFDDLGVAHDGERLVTLTFTRGEQVKTFPLTFPVQIHRGVYQVGHTYAKGDGVTWGGSAWVAREATSEKPGDGATAWQMAVRAGREGKEGKVGPAGPAGPRGEKGETVAKW